MDLAKAIKDILVQAPKKPVEPNVEIQTASNDGRAAQTTHENCGKAHLPPPLIVR